MPTVPLPSEWVEYLRQQPETGMDYHVVGVILQDVLKLEQLTVRGASLSRWMVFRKFRFPPPISSKSKLTTRSGTSEKIRKTVRDCLKFSSV
jgi:hypothetical protein